MMRPEEIALAVLRRWWIVALAALAAALVAFVATSSQPKTYTVSTRVMAIAEPPDYWMDLYAKNRLASYKDLINNWEFVRWSLEQAGSTIDPGLAQSRLALGHNPDSNIVQIVANDTEPERAATIVNALADGFVLRNAEENAELLDRPRPANAGLPGMVTMAKLETPGAPTIASGPRVKVNTLVAGVLGAVAGLMLAFGLLYLDDTLKKTADLERYLELPVLARVPEGDAGGSIREGRTG
ncbi:MAG: lipopolysaccharide biosynthesis protein [Chloroflexota bacterium]|nr:lipopolysaccharide biosynthesis protein [Chloroflexota bacterium]